MGQSDAHGRTTLPSAPVDAGDEKAVYPPAKSIAKSISRFRTQQKTDRKLTTLIPEVFRIALPCVSQAIDGKDFPEPSFVPLRLNAGEVPDFQSTPPILALPWPRRRWRRT